MLSANDKLLNKNTIKITTTKNKQRLQFIIEFNALIQLPYSSSLLFPKNINGHPQPL